MGALFGGAGGAVAGAIIGSIVPGVGTAVGALVGGYGGGLAGGAASAMSDQNIFTGKSKDKGTSPDSLPSTPTVDESIAKAEKIMDKKRSSASRTIYSNPLGLSNQAEINRKMLLGE